MPKASSFIAMNEICIKVGMSELEILKLSENAMTYFSPEFTVEAAQVFITQSQKPNKPKRTRRDK